MFSQQLQPPNSTTCTKIQSISELRLLVKIAMSFSIGNLSVGAAALMDNIEMLVQKHFFQMIFKVHTALMSDITGEYW